MKKSSIFYLVDLFAIGIIGFVLGYSGLTVTTWQFWAIVICAIVKFNCGRGYEYHR